MNEKIEKSEKEKESNEILTYPEYCSIWERHWSAKMSPGVIRKAIERGIVREPCVKDILEKMEQK